VSSRRAARLQVSIFPLLCALQAAVESPVHGYTSFQQNGISEGGKFILVERRECNEAELTSYCVTEPEPVWPRGVRGGWLLVPDNLRAKPARLVMGRTDAKRNTNRGQQHQCTGSEV
jgi:hypothetical protein